MDKEVPCEGCPIQTGLAAADKFINAHTSYYRNESKQEAARGFVAMRVEQLGHVAAAMECVGPQSNSENEVICPIGHAYNLSVESVPGPNAQSKSEYDYESLVSDAKESHRPDAGQYL